MGCIIMLSWMELMFSVYGGSKKWGYDIPGEEVHVGRYISFAV